MNLSIVTVLLKRWPEDLPGGQAIGYANTHHVVTGPNPLRLPELLVPLIGQSEYHVREELFETQIDFL